MIGLYHIQRHHLNKIKPNSNKNVFYYHHIYTLDNWVPCVIIIYLILLFFDNKYNKINFQ